MDQESGFVLSDFELDSLQVVQALQKRVVDVIEFCVLIKDCLSLLQREPYFSMAFIQKQNNVVAHTIARNAIVNAGFKVWNDPPIVIQTMLCIDDAIS